MPYENGSDSNNIFTVDLADRIIKQFEATLLRPVMYVGRKNSPESIIHFADGFESALRLSVEFPIEYKYESVSLRFYSSRRWNSGLFTPLKKFREDGMDEEEIVKELIKFEIEKWKMFRRELITKSNVR
jgi:hypothetical protein